MAEVVLVRAVRWRKQAHKFFRDLLGIAVEEVPRGLHVNTSAVRSHQLGQARGIGWVSLTIDKNDLRALFHGSEDLIKNQNRFSAARFREDESPVVRGRLRDNEISASFINPLPHTPEVVKLFDHVSHCRAVDNPYSETTTDRERRFYLVLRYAHNFARATIDPHTDRFGALRISSGFPRCLYLLLPNDVGDLTQPHAAQRHARRPVVEPGASRRPPELR